MIEFIVEGDLPEVIQFPRCRLHIALHRAMHPDGGQLVSMLPTDLDNRPIGTPLSGRYLKPAPARRGRKAKPGRPIAAALHKEFLVATKGIGREKAANATAKKLGYEVGDSIRHVIERGMEALTAFDAGSIWVFDSPGDQFVFVFHKSAAIQTVGKTLILEGICWYWDLTVREARCTALRVVATGPDPISLPELPDRIRKK